MSPIQVTSISIDDNLDIFILGGGPSGIAAAILAARTGFRVMVADHVRPPIDKACGEGLMPDAVAALATAGITFTPGEAAVFRGIRFVETATNTAVSAKFPGHGGLAVRRTALHAKLVQCALDAGVSFAWNARVTEMATGELVCDGRRIESRWIVGADGEHSKIRRWVTPEPPRHQQIRFGSRQHFRVVPWTDFVEVYWGENCQAVVTPLGPDEIGIAITSHSSHIRVAGALRELPELARRVSGASTVSRERGARCGLRILTRVQRDRFALIGDASGSVDPLTGEGLGLAFRQAAALADALKCDNLPRYETAHKQISKVSRLMSRLLLVMDQHRWFRDRVFRAFAAEPEMFSRLLSTHISALRPAAFGIGNAARLGWRLVSSPTVEA